MGFRIPIGLIRDTLYREPPSYTISEETDFARLRIRIDSVLVEDAAELDLLVDGMADSAQDTVRWNTAPDVQGRRQIFWDFPISGC